MKKRIIAIYADSFNGKVGLTLPYMQFVRNFGIPRLITPDDDGQELVENCDMLIVPGGADVDSSRYGEAPGPFTTRANMHYEYMDKNILPYFIEAGKPVVGICRGMQSLNVTFGGSLFQHVVGHAQGSNRNVTGQDMVDSEGNMHKINTLHHQAVKKLGEGLNAIGWTEVYQGCPSLNEADYLTTQQYTFKDKQGNKKLENNLSIVEAFEHKNLPILGFQYHPEEFNCSFAINRIEAMLESVENVVEA